MPLIKGWKLGFLPLRGNEEVEKAYKVRGYPSNFLYGPDGRMASKATLSAARFLPLKCPVYFRSKADSFPKQDACFISSQSLMRRGHTQVHENNYISPK
jgi:hypothetical protein